MQLCTGLPSHADVFERDQEQLQQLSGSLNLQGHVRHSDFSFDELLALNSWRHDELSQALDMLTNAGDHSKREAERKLDESARNRIKAATAHIQGVYCDEPRMQYVRHLSCECQVPLRK